MTVDMDNVEILAPQEEQFQWSAGDGSQDLNFSRSRINGRQASRDSEFR